MNNAHDFISSNEILILVILYFVLSIFAWVCVITFEGVEGRRELKIVTLISIFWPLICIATPFFIIAWLISIFTENIKRAWKEGER